MGKSRAQIQKEYRERKKNSKDGVDYVLKERDRVRKYNKRMKFVLKPEEKLRRKECRRQYVRRYRTRKKIKQEQLDILLSVKDSLPCQSSEPFDHDLQIGRETPVHQENTDTEILLTLHPVQTNDDIEKEVELLLALDCDSESPVDLKNDSHGVNSDPEPQEATIKPKMAETHVKPNKRKTRGSAKNTEKSTMEDKEKICSVLRESVLKLCQENYKSAVEVDGLICISVVNSTEQHVVKIHDMLTENGQIFTSVANTGKSTQIKSRANIQDTEPRPVHFVQNSANISSSNIPSKKTRQPVAQTSKDSITEENSARFPFLVQTLKESHLIQSRASSASPTVHSSGTSDRSIYGTLDPNSPSLETDRSASNLLKLLSSQKQQQEKTAPSKLPENSVQKDGSEFLEVKEEPVDDEFSNKQGSSNDGDDQGANNLSDDQSNTLTVKPEPEWNISDYGGQSKPNKEPNSNDSQEKEESAEASKRKSILAKILNGKEEAYKKSRKKAAAMEVQKVQHTDKSDEQDSSLLYRLPFSTFQDLFPIEGETKSLPQGIASKPTDSKNKGKKGKSDLELIMRKMLEDKSDKKAQPRRKKKKTVPYEEFEYFSPEDEDSPEVPSDNDDDNYVPSQRELIEDHEIVKSPRVLRKPKKTEKKRSVAVKSTTKIHHPNKTLNAENIDIEKYRYECYHCHLRFADRMERDEHEEQKCISELIVCDICKGYFANTSSRNKHLFEVHNILPEEQRHEIKEGKVGALDEFRPVTSEHRFDLDPSDQVPKFDIDASSYHDDDERKLVTKFIVPYDVKNEQNFIKCPLCINFFSDIDTKDQHLKKKHNIANQIDNGDGTVSLQTRDQKPSTAPPVYVKYEHN